MTPKPRASRHLGRRRPSSLGAAPWAEAFCWALMLHLGVATWWGGELERRATAPQLEPLASVPPSAPRAVRWEPRPAARVSLAPTRTPARDLREHDPAPAPREPVPELPAPQDDAPVAEELVQAPPVVDAWGALRGARAPRSTREVERAADTSRDAAPPAADEPPDDPRDDAAPLEPDVAPAEVDAAPEADTPPDPDAPPALEPPPDDVAPGEVAEPAPAPSDAASANTARPLADNLPPAYPRLALRRGWEGRVLLEVDVGADGVARAVRVLTSSGVPLLDRTARDAVAGWRFEPARRDERAVAGTTTVALRFRLDAGDVSAEGDADR